MEATGINKSDKGTRTTLRIYSMHHQKFDLNEIPVNDKEGGRSLQ